MLNNIKNAPVLIIGFTILLLILLSFLPKKIKVAGILVKPVDLFMDVKPDSLLNYSDPCLLHDPAAKYKIDNQLEKFFSIV